MSGQRRIGWLALVLLTICVAIFSYRLSTDDNTTNLTQWQAGTLRVGLIFAAIWLAWPDLAKLPPRFAGLMLTSLIVSAIILWRWPLYFPLALLITMGIYLLRPRSLR
jgi:hypothetical protein